MGEVYRARDTKLGREVAIKILPPEFAADTIWLGLKAVPYRIPPAVLHRILPAMVYTTRRVGDGL